MYFIISHLANTVYSLLLIIYTYFRHVVFVFSMFFIRMICVIPLFVVK